MPSSVFHPFSVNLVSFSTPFIRSEVKHNFLSTHGLCTLIDENIFQLYFNNAKNENESTASLLIKSVFS